MPSTYPTTLDSLSNPSTVSFQNNPPHSEQHTNANDAIEAIEAELGTTPSGAAATVAARFTAAETATSDHLVDATDAHDATAISYAGGTGMSATNVETAIDELATEKLNAAEKAAASGVASLDGSTKVPIAQVPTGTSGTTVALGNHLHTYVGCKATKAAAQSVANVTEVALTFDTEEWDTDAIHSTGTNPTRFTAHATGKWRFFYSAHVTAGTANNACSLNLRLGGATAVNGSLVQAIFGTANGVVLTKTFTVTLSAAEYIEVIAFHNSGGAEDFGGTTTLMASVEAQYLGA